MKLTVIKLDWKILRTVFKKYPGSWHRKHSNNHKKKLIRKSNQKTETTFYLSDKHRKTKESFWPDYHFSEKYPTNFTNIQTSEENFPRKQNTEKLALKKWVCPRLPKTTSG